MKIYSTIFFISFIFLIQNVDCCERSYQDDSACSVTSGNSKMTGQSKPTMFNFIKLLPNIIRQLNCYWVNTLRLNFLHKNDLEKYIETDCNLSIKDFRQRLKYEIEVNLGELKPLIDEEFNNDEREINGVTLTDDDIFFSVYLERGYVLAFELIIHFEDKSKSKVVISNVWISLPKNSWFIAMLVFDILKHSLVMGLIIHDIFNSKLLQNAYSSSVSEKTSVVEMWKAFNTLKRFYNSEILPIISQITTSCAPSICNALIAGRESIIEQGEYRIGQPPKQKSIMTYDASPCVIFSMYFPTRKVGVLFHADSGNRFLQDFGRCVFELKRDFKTDLFLEPFITWIFSGTAENNMSHYVIYCIIHSLDALKNRFVTRNFDFQSHTTRHGYLDLETGVMFNIIDIE